MEPPAALDVVNDCVAQLDPSRATKLTMDVARGDLAALLQDSLSLYY
jgi:hypothetical protein